MWGFYNFEKHMHIALTKYCWETHARNSPLAQAWQMDLVIVDVYKTYLTSSIEAHSKGFHHINYVYSISMTTQSKFTGLNHVFHLCCILFTYPCNIQYYTAYPVLNEIFYDKIFLKGRTNSQKQFMWKEIFTKHM